MKIAGIILAVLMLTGSALVGVIGSNKSMDLGKDVAKITDGLSDAQIAEAGIPSPGRLKFGGIVAGVMLLLGAGGALLAKRGANKA